jgi:hypothetical protein
MFSSNALRTLWAISDSGRFSAVNRIPSLTAKTPLMASTTRTARRFISRSSTRPLSSTTPLRAVTATWLLTPGSLVRRTLTAWRRFASLTCAGLDSSPPERLRAPLSAFRA